MDLSTGFPHIPQISWDANTLALFFHMLFYVRLLYQHELPFDFPSLPPAFFQGRVYFNQPLKENKCKKKDTAKLAAPLQLIVYILRCGKCGKLFIHKRNIFLCCGCSVISHNISYVCPCLTLDASKFYDQTNFNVINTFNVSFNLR